MAVRIDARYDTERKLYADLAKKSFAYDQNYHKSLIDAQDFETEGNYLKSMYAITTKAIPSSFSMEKYEGFRDYENKLAYIQAEMFPEAFKEGEVENVKKSLDQIYDQDARITKYENLNAFKKFRENSKALVVGMLNTVLQGVESLVNIPHTIERLTTPEQYRLREKVDITPDAFYDYTIQNSGVGISDTATYIHQVGLAVANMLPIYVSPNLAGKAVLYGSSFMRGINESLDQDHSEIRAITSSAMNTGIEIGFESLGGSMLFGDKGLIKAPIAKNLITRMLVEGFGEGLEEVGTEITTSIMNKLIYDLNDPSVTWMPTLNQVLLAGSIGAILGMSGPLVRSYTISSETGSMNVFTNYKRLFIQESLTEMNDMITDTPVQNAAVKGGYASVAEFQEKNPEGYAKAQKEQEKLVIHFTKLNNILSDMYAKFGEEEMAKAFKLVDSYMTWEETVRNAPVVQIAAMASNNEVKDSLTKYSKNKGVRIDVAVNLAPQQIKIKQNLETLYPGKKVVFGNVYSKKRGKISNEELELLKMNINGLMIDDNTILLDYCTTQSTDMEFQKMQEVVAEEILHSMIYKDGAISTTLLDNVDNYVRKKAQRKIPEVDLAPEYGKLKLSKKAIRAEQQAQGLIAGKMLMYDDISIDYLFGTNKNGFVKLLNYFHNLRKNTKNNQIKFSILSKVMNKYKNILKSNISNKEELDTLSNLNQDIKNEILPSLETRHRAFIKAD